MRASRALARFLMQRPWLAAVAAGLPAAALVAYLLYGFYDGRQAQISGLRQDELAHTQALCVSLDNFLSTLQAEVVEIADGREVAAWFENAALGLSLEYGLRISLVDLQHTFNKRLSHRLPGGEPLLARLVLLDADARVVLDSEHPERDPGAELSVGWLPPKGGAQVVSDYLTDWDQIVIGAECRVLDRHTGWLVAFVPAATMQAQIQGAGRASTGNLWLSWAGRAMGSEPPPAAVSLVAGATKLLDELHPGDGPRMLSSARAAHFPLTVTRAGAVDRLLATDPRAFLWGLAGIAGLLMGLSGLVWWAQLHAQALRLRLESEARHGRDLVARQRELEDEIQQRRRIEAELVQARDAAESASRAKSQFLANMSHEIRTPLNGVLGMTELVLDTELDEQQREQLEIALESGRSLLTVISDVLDVSALETGSLRLATVRFDPRAELANLRRALLAVAEKRGLDLKWDVDQALPAAVHGDPVRLRQILTNLLGNALKFTERGTVGLRVRVDGGEGGWQRFTFEVSDTGIGIPADKQALIFEAFQQVDGSHTRRYGGNGLGLHISDKLVTMMGGKLELESREGDGSCFRFSLDLPLAETAPRPATAGREEPRRLLVAEDNAFNRKVVQALLHKWGHEVTVTNDGQEALSALHAGGFDAALLDVQMPVMDGLEVARRWRAHELAAGLPHLPLIALTAHAQPGDDEMCLEAGMDAHLPKPLDGKVLRETLTRVTPAPAVPAAH